MVLSILQIHPVIRIVCFLLLGYYVVSAQPIHLTVASLLLLVGYSLGQWHQLLRCWRLLRRLKWLFLSIFSIYVLLTPGRPVLDGFGDVITVEGIALGLLRVYALVILILAVNLMIRTAERSELVFALLWILSPLRIVKFPVERLAVRMVLTLDYVSEFQALLVKESTVNEADADEVIIDEQVKADTKIKYATKITERLSIRQKVNLAADKASENLKLVIQRATDASCQAIQKPVIVTPPLWQWIYPVSLTLVFAII